MLHGAALARLVPAHGIALPAAIAETAQRERAHPAVQAEISYFRAVTHWSADEFEEAAHRPNVARPRRRRPAGWQSVEQALKPGGEPLMRSQYGLRARCQATMWPRPAARSDRTHGLFRGVSGESAGSASSRRSSLRVALSHTEAAARLPRG
jgi:hypothetical protein